MNMQFDYTTRQGEKIAVIAIKRIVSRSHVEAAIAYKLWADNHRTQDSRLKALRSRTAADRIVRDFVDSGMGYADDYVEFLDGLDEKDATLEAARQLTDRLYPELAGQSVYWRGAEAQP